VPERNPDPPRTVLANVCTQSHLPLARCMVSSFAEHHPGIDVVVSVVDGETGRCPEIRGATTIAGEEIGGARFKLLALKYSPFELSASMKPYLLEHLLVQGRYDKVLYLDSDVHVFSPLSELLQDLERSAFVVTPHTVGPTPPHWNRRERPMLAHVAEAGVLNSGVFGLRDTAHTRRFVATWKDLCTRYGAFSRLGDAAPLQTEQHAFNWVIGFVDGVRVLRSTAYNVAYWNLHDRSLRWSGLDEPADDRWTVDGEPLAAFHFSGYSVEEPWVLSRLHPQHLTHTDPSLEALVRFYERRLREEGAGTEAPPYRFGRFTSGIPIDDRMRRVFKRIELSLPLDLDPWTEDGEAVCCRSLLGPSPHLGSLAPALMQEMWDERPDLQAAFAVPRLRPRPLIEWFSAIGAAAEGYESLYERHRPTSVPASTRLRLDAVERESPGLLRHLPEPLGRDRLAASRRLEAAGHEALAADLARSDCFVYRLGEVHTVRAVLEKRPDLRRAFPDFLDGDAPALAAWLTSHGGDEEGIPPQVAELFAAKARGCSLARIFSFLEHNPHLVDRWPLALVGVDGDALALELLAVLRGGDPEYDLDDVALYAWTMTESPWKGLPLTLEFTRHLCRKPCPRLPEGQEALLAPVLGDRRFVRALDDYRSRYDTEHERETEAWVRRFERAPSVYARWDDRAAGHREPDAKAVNLFGPLRSTIGLGSMARGLLKSLATTVLDVNPVLVGNTGLDADVGPDDLVRNHRYDYGINLFVSYPHYSLSLLEAQPDHVVRGHHNVVYLAWEQRDGSQVWERIFADFDQLWALSEFAAGPLRRFTGREVEVVPCCLDVHRLPPAAAKAELGFAPERELFLSIFDPQSSVERKNPAAVIEAFRRAFRSDDTVTLVMKISHPDCYNYREQVRQLVDLGTSCGLDVRFQVENLLYPDLMRLMSACDAYVSLHRAEGFGLTCAEAMAYERPVVATRYSGNLDFMDDSCAFLVDAAEVAVHSPDGPYPRGSVWADPDLDQAAGFLRTIVENPGSARRRGVAARERVVAQLSPEAVGRLAEQALLRHAG
jgi:glycosyltransferase involved in cell wall biosynthesis